MKVKKAIKKIVALGVGATMVGATLLGASAADLGKFPSQYIDADGSYNGLFVVGAAAEPADIIGINDLVIAVSKKAVNKVWVETQGTGTTTFSAEDGVFVASGSKTLVLGDDLSGVTTTFDVDDLPDLLESGVVVDDDGEDEEYEYDQELEISDAVDVLFQKPSDTDNGIEPVPMLVLGTDTVLTYTVDFDDSDVVFGDSGDDEGFQNNEKIVMLGTEFTFKTGIDADGDITLFKSATSVTVDLGESVEVKIGDKTYVIELLFVDSDQTRVTVKVNADSETMTEGQQKKISGLQVNLDDIRINTIGDQRAQVKLYLGADEYVIKTSETYANADVEVNGEEVDGVTVSVDVTGDLSAVSALHFEFNPSEFDMGDEPDVDELQVGDYFVDPLFGALKFQFMGPEMDDLMSSEDVIKLSGGDEELELSFVDSDGNDVSVKLFEYNTGDDVEELYNGDYIIHPSVVNADQDTELTDLAEDHVFILSNKDPVLTDEDGVTVLLEVVKINYEDDLDSENYVKFKNMNTGDTFEVTEGNEVLDTEAYVVVTADDAFNLTESDLATAVTGLNVLRTENFGLLEIAAEFEGNDTDYDIEAGSASITFSEDVLFWDDSDYTAEAGEVFNLDVNADDEYEITATGWTAGAKTMDDYSYYLSEVGTYGVWNNDDKDSVELYVPDRMVQYNVWVGPVSAEGSSSISGGGVWVNEPVPIPKSASVLDREVANVAAQNMIVVGGPCVNTVALNLMGATRADCTAGFAEGKAKIKFYEQTGGKVALLVAGYSAADTRAATGVMYDFVVSGLHATKMDGKSEVEVTTLAGGAVEIGAPTPVAPPVVDEE